MFQERHHDCYEHPKILEAVTTIFSNVDTPHLARDHHGLKTSQGMVQMLSTEMNTSHPQEIHNHNEQNVLVDSNTKLGSLNHLDMFAPMSQSFFPQLVFQHNDLDSMQSQAVMNSNRISSYESQLHSSNISTSIENTQSGYGSFTNVQNDTLKTPTPEMILSNFYSLYNTQPVTGSKIGYESLHTVPYQHDDGLQKRPRSTPYLCTDEKTRKKKEAHNAIERRRRDLINDRISELSYLVPQCHEAILQSIGRTHESQETMTTNMSSHVRLNKTFILEKSAEYIRQLQNVLYRQAMLLKASNINDEMLDHVMAAVMPHCPSPYLDSENQGYVLAYDPL